MAFLPFCRLRTVIANAVQPVYLYTQPLMTRNFVQVVAALRVDAPMLGSVAATFDAAPQLSNDMVNWKDATPTFTQLTPGSTYPVVEVKAITEVAWFMRYKLTLWDGMAGVCGLCLSLFADGKVHSERRETSLEFLAALQTPQLGGAGLVQFPLSPFRQPMSAASAAKTAIPAGSYASQAAGATGTGGVQRASSATASVNPAIQRLISSARVVRG